MTPIATFRKITREIKGEVRNFLVIDIDIPDGNTTPQEVETFWAGLEKQLVGAHCVVINGRGPTWLFGMGAHAGHPSQAVLFNDPRLGWICVQSHVEWLRPGEVIDNQP